MKPFGELPPLIRDPIFLILLAWLAEAFGYRIARLARLRIQPFAVEERALIYATLGAAGLQYLPLGLAVFRHLSVVAVRSAVASLAVVLTRDLFHIIRRAPAAIRQWRPRLAPATAIWLLVLAAFMGTLLVRSLVVGVMGDDDGYHLTAPRRWLEAGSLVYLPTYSHTNAPMGFEMLDLVALATWGVEGAKLLHFAAGILLLCAVFLLGRRIGSGVAGCLAISVLLVPNPIWDVPFLFGMAYNDLAVCWMAVTSLLALQVWRRSGETSILMCAAVCAGFAGTYKFTALSVGLALTVLVVAELARQRVKWPRALRLTLTCGALCIAPIAPWLARNWILTGNPVYPMASSLIPTRDWTPELSRVFGKFFRYYNWGKAAGPGLAEAQRRELLVATCLGFLIVLVVTFVRERRTSSRDLVTFSAVVLTAALSLTGLYFRFWLPATVCLVVLACLILVERLGEPAARWCSVAILMIGLGMRSRAEAPDLGSEWRMVSGQTTRAQEYRAKPLWRTWEYLNGQTRRDAHVLIAAFYTTFGASSGGAFWVQRIAYVTDSQMQAVIRLDDWTDFLRSIRLAGIDFVVISDTQFAAQRYGFSFTAGQNEYPFCRRLVSEYGTLVSQYEHLQIYRLRQPELTE